MEECLEVDPVQFYLDCSTMPAVICVTQAEGEGVLRSLSLQGITAMDYIRQELTFYCDCVK